MFPDKLVMAGIIVLIFSDWLQYPCPLWEKFPNGGGVNFFSKKSQFQFGNFAHPGGVSIFQKCPNLNYFAIILQYYLYKKCRKIKNVWIWSEGGGSAIFKNVWNSKKSEISDGGGVKPIWEFFPNFSGFFLWWLPLAITFSPKLNQTKREKYIERTKLMFW